MFFNRRSSVLAVLVPALALAGCGGGDGGGEGEGEGEASESTLDLCTDGYDNDRDSWTDCFDRGCAPFQSDCAPPLTFDDLEDNVPQAASDFTCLHDNAPEPPGDGAVTARFYAQDFETEERVEGVQIEVYLGNRIEGEPDLVVGPTDEQGLSEEVSVPSGAFVATRTLAVENQVRLTVEFDVRMPTEDGEEVRALSVSDSTYRIVPATVGVVIQAGKGVVAGMFSDCNDDPVTGAIVSIPGEEADVRYFWDGMPSREPVVTTQDGLYVAINVAPGDHELEISGRLQEGGDVEILGGREIQVLADSINVVDILPLAQ